jgi:hypothetical protein
LDKRLHGLQSRSGRSLEDKNTQLLPELELLLIQPVAQCYIAELFGSSYENGSIIKRVLFLFGLNNYYNLLYFARCSRNLEEP